MSRLPHHLRAGALCCCFCWLLAFLLSAQGAWACKTTKVWVIPRSPIPVRIDEVLNAMFPTFLVTYDSGAGMLSVTGCAKAMGPLEKLVTAYTSGNEAEWKRELENQLWNSGSFTCPVYEWTLRRPPSVQWKLERLSDIASPGVKALKGDAIFGMQLQRGKARLDFDVFDLSGEHTAQGILAALPGIAQGARDSRWADTLAESPGRRLGGTVAVNSTCYMVRDLWQTGTGGVVREVIAVAQVTPGRDATRVYLFTQLAKEKEYPQQRGWTMDIANGLGLPETPPRPLAPHAATLITKTTVKGAAQPAGPGNASDASDAADAGNAGDAMKTGTAPGTLSRTADPIHKIHQSSLPSLKTANTFSANGDFAAAEKAYKAALDTTPPAMRPELALAIAGVQAQQKRYTQAIATLEEALRHASEPATEFEIHMRLGTLRSTTNRDWKSAESHFGAARRLAPDTYSQWRADCQLARVPYYLKQYKQAIKDFEVLLQSYPTSQTAKFARPYLWYLKNCTEKKL